MYQVWTDGGHAYFVHSSRFKCRKLYILTNTLYIRSIYTYILYNYVQLTKTMVFDKNTDQHCYQKGGYNAGSSIQYKYSQEPHDGLGS